VWEIKALHPMVSSRGRGDLSTKNYDKKAQKKKRPPRSKNPGGPFSRKKKVLGQKIYCREKKMGYPLKKKKRPNPELEEMRPSQKGIIPTHMVTKKGISAAPKRGRLARKENIIEKQRIKVLGGRKR